MSTKTVVDCTCRGIIYLKRRSSNVSRLFSLNLSLYKAIGFLLLRWVKYTL